MGKSYHAIGILLFDYLIKVTAVSMLALVMWLDRHEPTALSSSTSDGTDSASNVKSSVEKRLVVHRTLALDRSSPTARVLDLEEDQALFIPFSLITGHFMGCHLH